MFSKEIFGFLGKVISSWQVIVVTIALILYFKLVFYVVHPRRRSSFSYRGKVKRKKRERPAKAVEVVPENEELGLDEE